MQLCYNHASPRVRRALASALLGTALGTEAIARMKLSGVSVDLSHCDELATLQAIAASDGPVLITHAGCSAIHPHPRNKSDVVLRALAQKGGVFGLYGSPFLSAGPGQQTLEDYLAHVSHALSVCGEDHVGLGSDSLLTVFDISPGSPAAWDSDIGVRRAKGIAAPGEGRPHFEIELNRPDRLEVVADALNGRGYSPRTVEKVLGLNFNGASSRRGGPE